MRLIAKCDQLIEKLCDWQEDDEMRLAQNGSSVPHDRVVCRDFYNRTYSGASNMLVGVQNNDEIVGAYMLEDIDIQHLRLYMHFVFQVEGRRAALKESATAIVDYCFNELHMRTLLGYIAVTNSGATSFVEKMGWSKIGCIPDYFNSAAGWISGNLFILRRDDERAF